MNTGAVTARRACVIDPEAYLRYVLSQIIEPPVRSVADLLRWNKVGRQDGCVTPDSEKRCEWRARWLNSLREFADSELQHRTWLDATNRNPHWSYSEFFCSYFDDTLYGPDYDWALSQGLVTQEEVAVIGPLHELLKQHQAPGGDDFDHDRVLSDPAWALIVSEAKQAQERLAAFLQDPSEQSLLLRQG